MTPTSSRARLIGRSELARARFATHRGAPDKSAASETETAPAYGGRCLGHMVLRGGRSSRSFNAVPGSTVLNAVLWR